MSIFDVGQERIDEILREYTENKMSRAAIAEKYNMMNIVVERIISKNNVKWRSGKIDKSDYLGIVKEYTVDLKPTRLIAKEFNCSPRAILRVLNKSGVDTSKAGAGNLNPGVR